jgi:D-serine deaminase-like pyridoxal phosphate-dependent protein
MRVSLEIDVGLHRGGFDPGPDFVAALATIASDPEHLELAGFMGYEAHVGRLPGWLGERAFRAARARYEELVTLARRSQPALLARPLTLNGAGSLTYRRYEGDTLLNDLSAGSCLVMPTHFDVPRLADHEPAAFIATPVLKRLPGTRVPGVEWAAPLAETWNPNLAQTYFLYGGNWLAELEAPPGLSPNGFFVSSNQQGVNAPASVPLAVDDFVFLRPTQSESVLLQFGDLVVVRGDRIVERWPVLSS